MEDYEFLRICHLRYLCRHLLIAFEGIVGYEESFKEDTISIRASSMTFARETCKGTSPLIGSFHHSLYDFMEAHMSICINEMMKRGDIFHCNKFQLGCISS
ncbi:uncharacterized protein LOC115985198 [Quercus lobata]|uniref:uncharacterized protein LOC115985198 n=1 Tax=Quercus lobata TaxID=97700 RepID=UPI00124907E5|nr:uncharacterized protein LOC115985198 [Quercus lobata]